MRGTKTVQKTRKIHLCHDQNDTTTYENSAYINFYASQHPFIAIVLKKIEYEYDIFAFIFYPIPVNVLYITRWPK